ncbi:MAG: ABC transporter permease [Chloroflexota bacterium]
MSRPAAPIRAVGALAAHELALTARRGENVLVTILIPVAVLLFFGTVGAVPGIEGRPVDFLLPGVLALAMIACAFVSLSIVTAYERTYGALKRLGGAPLPAWGLVAAKAAAAVAMEAIQVAVLLAVAGLVLGWRLPESANLPVVALALILGTVAFAGLGLALAGTLRAEAVLALANGLFLACLVFGGIVVPLDVLPDGVATAARLLPAAALADLLRAGLTGTPDGVGPAAVLVAWSLGAAVVAARTFRWD